MFNNKKKLEEQEVPLLLQIFALEHVEILLRDKVTLTRASAEGEVVQESAPIAIQGFVMDACQQFLYLGDDGETVNQAIPLDTISYIKVIQPHNAFDEMLDEIPAPGDKKEYN